VGPLCVWLAYACQCVHIGRGKVDCQWQAMASRQKNVAISIRVTEEVKNAAEKAAEDDTRSVTSYVEKLIIEDLKAKGYLKETREQLPPVRPAKKGEP
jgi:hypothetical protein